MAQQAKDDAVLFYTSNLDKPSPKPADPVADLKGMAKGMFKKILG